MRPLLNARLLLSGVLCCGTLLAGCAAVGVVADKVIGKAPVPAVYTLGLTTTVLVLVENYQDPSMNATDSERVGRMIANVLETKKAAIVISPDKLVSVRDSHAAAFSRMSVVDIGKAVGAAKVIYINLGGVAVGAQQGSDMLKGISRANVKVIDVVTGGVAFPADMSEGYPVDFSSPMRRGAEGITPDAIRGETLVGLSTAIARLFYSYEPGELESIDDGL